MEKGLNFLIEEQEGIKVVHLTGNISNVTKDEFQTLINELAQKNSVIVEISNVNLFTSSGLDALQSVSIDARAGNNRVLILGANENLIKMVEILDVYDDFIFIESIEEGLIKLKYYT